MQLTLQHIAPLAVGVFLALTAGFCDSPTKSARSLRPDCWKPLEPPSGGVLAPADDGPKWSFDGSRFLFLSGFDSCSNPDQGLWIADVTGRKLQKLPRFFSYYHWLPGDTQLIVNLGFFSGGQLAIYDLLRDRIDTLGVPTKLIIFDLSADGEYVYYFADSNWINEFHLPTRSTKRIVLSQGLPSVSPDRQKLVIGRNGMMTIFSIADSTFVEVGPLGFPGDWKLDGSGFFHQKGSQIRFADTLGSDSVVLEMAGDIPSLSPNGRDLLYIGYLGIGVDPWARVWRLDIFTGEKRLLTF